MVKLPRLYVNEKFSRILHPISLQITQNIEPLSTASITLREGDELPARSYVELFTPYGSAGMFRVRSPHNVYGSGYSTAELEHMIAELGDYVVKAEYNKMYKATTAVSNVFQHYKGSKWRLGKYSDIGSGQIALEAKYDSVLNALLSILEQKPDCMLKYDFTTSPWTLSIVKKGTSVVAEGRLSRNIKNATVTYDDSELVTRVWYQKFDSDKKATWVSKDADTLKTYGLIEGTVSTSSDMTSAEIDSLVNTYIAEHKNPRTSVSINAHELNSITGERMDKFILGDLFRLNLKDYDLTVELHVTSISWGDVINTPESVAVHLGAEEDTVVTFLHNLDATGSGTSGGAGGGSNYRRTTMQNNEFSTKIDQTDQTVHLYAQRTDNNGKILEKAGMYIDSKGTLIYATDNENNIMSRIDTKVNSITISSKRVKIEGEYGVTLNDVFSISNHAAVFRKDVYITDKYRLRTSKLVITKGGEIDFFNTASSGIALKYDHVNEMIIKAVKDGNTLKLWKRGDNPDGDPSINFSKATDPLSMSWVGSSKSVKAVGGDQSAYYNVDYRFYKNPGDQSHPNGQYVIQLIHSDSSQTIPLAKTDTEIKLGLSGTTVQIQNKKGQQIAPSYSPTLGLSSYLDTLSVDENGEWTAPEGKIGFKKVTVNVSQPDPEYSTTFSSTGSFQSSQDPGNVLAGWSPVQISGVPNSSNNTYRYIKFKVDGVQRSFYFA